MANTHGQPLEDPTPTPCKTHSHPLEDPRPTLGGPNGRPSEDPSPNFIFLRAASGSSLARLRASRGLGMLRAISACWVPRSTRRVVIWGWKSPEDGCRRTLSR